MKFRHEHALPHYYAADLRDDAKQINSLIAADDDAADMACIASRGELVFEGFCKVEDLARIAKLCDEMIFAVTDERAE